MTNPIGRFLRARRLDLGMSQSALALDVGVARERVNRWESGARAVPDGCLARLAASLDVPEGELRSLRLDPPRRTRNLHCAYAVLDPVACSVEEMASTPLGSRLSAMVRERVGEAWYDDVRHALLRDTRWELMLAHRLLLDTAMLSWVSPLEEGCEVLIVSPGGRTFAGHHLRLGVVWERDEERMVFLPQVPIAAARTDERFRVDYLVLYTCRGERKPPVVVELDGWAAHRFQQAQDTRRTEQLRLPVARFDNSATEHPEFLGALFERIREKAEFAKISGDAYQGFLDDRRERVAEAVRSGRLPR